MSSTRAFYFALPRLRTGRGASEGTAGEAYFGSAIILAVTYFLLVDLVQTRGVGATVAKDIGLVFATCVFWVVMLYFNSLIIRGVRQCGFLGSISNRSAQHFLVTVLLTLFAAELWIQPAWNRWVGAAYLLLLAINLVAAAFLRLRKTRPIAD
jgi:hypothetical protein